MVKTTQKYINGAAGRFAADNAVGKVKGARPKTDAERVSLYRQFAAACRAVGNERRAATWERVALQVGAP